MRKNAEKIFATAGVIVAIVMIVILVVTAFGGIKFEEFENSLVRGLFVTLGTLYAVLSVISLTMLFTSSEVVKEITLRSDKEGTSKATVGVIRKLVKNTCAGVEGVKSGKVSLIMDDYGVRLKINIKIIDKDVVETETYIRTMLEEVFWNAIGFRFNSIEIKVVSLQSKFKITQSEVAEQVNAIVAEKAAVAEAEKAAQIAQTEEVAAPQDENDSVTEIEENAETQEIEVAAPTTDTATATAEAEEDKEIVSGNEAEDVIKEAPAEETKVEEGEPQKKD